MKKAVVILSMFGTLLACSRGPNLQKTVDANKNAKDHLEWEASPENPKNTFQKYRDEQKTNPGIAKKVCDELLKLKGQELSIFEEEINNHDNSVLLAECKVPLQKILDEYWQEQKKTLQQTTLNFKFSTKTDKRDLSKGYRAKTGDVQPKELILTFDDGPDAVYTDRVLDILDMVNAKAMFFLLGPKVQASPIIVERLANEGHVLGSHSMTHHCLADSPACAKANGGAAMTHNQAIAEIRGGAQAIYDVVGFVDPFFRFPYGESDSSLVDFLAKKQVAQFHWSIESQDWKARPSQELLNDVLGQIDANQRGIVLFHDTQHRTLEILPEFLKAIYDRGYSLVILESMDDLARYNSQLVTTGPRLPYAAADEQDRH